MEVLKELMEGREGEFVYFEVSDESKEIEKVKFGLKESIEMCEKESKRVEVSKRGWVRI